VGKVDISDIFSLVQDSVSLQRMFQWEMDIVVETRVCCRVELRYTSYIISSSPAVEKVKRTVREPRQEFLGVSDSLRFCEWVAERGGVVPV
jgi:hypothetical protein